MKRFVVLLVVLVLCASLLVVPALASEMFEITYNDEHLVFSDYVFPEGSYIGQAYVDGVPYFDEKFSLDIVHGEYEQVVYLDVHKDGILCRFDLIVDATDKGTYVGSTALKNYLGDYFTLRFERIPDSIFDSSFSSIVSSDVLPDVIARLFQLITDNPLLSALCAASLILVCIPLFVDLKKSAR